VTWPAPDRNVQASLSDRTKADPDPFSGGESTPAQVWPIGSALAPEPWSFVIAPDCSGATDPVGSGLSSAAASAGRPELRSSKLSASYGLLGAKSRVSFDITR
jgi:hypothetical protein